MSTISNYYHQNQNDPIPSYVSQPTEYFRHDPYSFEHSYIILLNSPSQSQPKTLHNRVSYPAQ